MNYLGENAAKKLLKHMDDGDIRKLLTVMAKYRIVVPISTSPNEFLERNFMNSISESEDISSDKITGKENIIEAVGEERARGILGHLSASPTQHRGLESLELVDAKSLANF